MADPAVKRARRAQGRCTECSGEPMPRRAMCFRHAKRNAEYAAKRRRMAGEAPGVAVSETDALAHLKSGG